MQQPRSAFIVPVPEAEPCVRTLRLRYDETARLGVPAHITILSPFKDPLQIDAADIAAIRAALAPHSAFDFTVARAACFPATAYLVPEPSTAFVDLTHSLCAAFPAYPPFAGLHADIVPHLTVAHGSPEAAEVAIGELEAALRVTGPINAHCAAVVLLENSTGRWKEMMRFDLHARDTSASLRQRSRSKIPDPAVIRLDDA